MARTIGIENHVRNKPKGKIQESQKDRIRKMRELKKVNNGVVSSYAEDHARLSGTSKVPIKEVRMNEMGIGREVNVGIYDNQRFPHIAEVLCREYGFLAVQLAEVLGVKRTTVEKWVQLYPDFKAAVHRGREAFDTGKVEQSLLKRALGYEFTERTEKNVFLIGKKRNTDIEVAVPAREVVTMHKFMPPDVKAIMFWLQNRQPDRWKSVAYIQAQMTQNKTITHNKVSADITSMSVEQIKALRGLIVETRGIEQNAPIEIGYEEVGQIVYNAGQKLLGNEQEIEDYDFGEDE